jgi:GNAT superfamily N-acetyltransferase
VKSADETFEIRQVRPEELPAVREMFTREVWVDGGEAAERHFEDHAEGGGETFIAWAGDVFAGYVTIRWVSRNPRFRKANIPLIHDLLVFEQFQRRGIASALLDAAEALIATRATHAGITVGLFDDYGPAQRLYAKRGYIPDGRGACQGLRPLTLGEAVTVDHDLIIWLTKALR